MLEHALDDSAAKLIHAHVVDVSSEGLDNELDFLAWDLLDYLLDNMVAICVLNACDDVRTNLINNVVLQGRRQCLKGFLDDTAAILVARKGHYLALEVGEEGSSLVESAVLKHLLNYIVAKDIVHELMRLSHTTPWGCKASTLIEESLLLIVTGFLQALLDKARALLVERALDKVALELVKRHVFDVGAAC